MANSKKNRAVLERRYNEQDGRCYWCDTVMLPPSFNRGFGDKLPPNASTIEHLIPRGDPRRTENVHNGEIRRVAACFECNTLRGRYHNEVVLGADKHA